MTVRGHVDIEALEDIDDIDVLIARGLDRYRAGDIDGALTAWEAALAADPSEPRALGYVDYVRQNYDELTGEDMPMSELLIPFGLAHGDEDDYEISITSGDDGAVAERARTTPVATAPEPSVDDGWGLDAESEPTWFATSARQALDHAAVAVEAHDSGGAGWIELEAEEPTGDVPVPPGGPGGFGPGGFGPGGFGPGGFGPGGFGPGGFGDDERTRDFRDAMAWPGIDGTRAAPARTATSDLGEQSGEATIELGRGDFGPDFTGERTTERQTAKLAPEVLRGLGLAPVGEHRAASEDLTTEHWSSRGGLELAPLGGDALDLPPPPVIEPVVEPLPPVERFDDQGTADLKARVLRGRGEVRDDDRQSIEVEDLFLPPPPSMTAPIDDDSRDERAVPGRAMSADEDLSARLSREVDAGAPPRESLEERARRRIAALLARAQAAAAASDHATAVAAIDLALSEAPEVAAAQKLVHRSRDVILDCYYRFFGDLGRTPVMVAPLGELTRRPLDTRAAFLLSRIDGTLTFEEVLDVAGMGRLEACRHLAHLLWRGIIRAG